MINQLETKKSKIQNNIKEQQELIKEQQNELKKMEASLQVKIKQNNKEQEELKILEETIFNISDGIYLNIFSSVFFRYLYRYVSFSFVSSE